MSVGYILNHAQTASIRVISHSYLVASPLKQCPFPLSRERGPCMSNKDRF